MVSGQRGLVLEREGGTFRIATEGGEVMAVLRGKAKRSRYDRVVVGDRVTLDDGDEHGTLGITGVEPRRNLLERRTPSGRSNRPVAANLDRVYVVTSAADPQPIPQLIDRLCAIAEANEIPVALVVNKAELGSAEKLAARYRHAGYEVFLVSARTGEGLEPLFRELRGRESLLTGASGVGKSTILNRLQPGLALRTGEVSEKNRRGTVVTHGFYQPDELDGERARHAGGAAEPAAEPRSGGKLDEVLAELAALKERVSRLEARIA